MPPYSTNKFELVIYQSSIRDTYLYFIKEDLNLIKILLNQKKQLRQPFNPNRVSSLFKSRAKHLQIMTLLGATTEHLVKLILIKNGFIINKRCTKRKLGHSFLVKLDQYNQISHPSRRQVSEIYLLAKNYARQYSKYTFEFAKCIRKVNSSNNIPKPNSSPFIIGQTSRYLSRYRQINKSNCLSVIRHMRNSYTHLADAQSEVQGIVWYMYDYILCLAKKEFPNYFSRMHLIGNREIKQLFRNA